MNPIALMAIKMALSILAPFLKKLVDLAYREIEDWAKREERNTGEKPSGEAKMARAVASMKLRDRTVSTKMAKALLELKAATEEKKKKKRGKAK